MKESYYTPETPHGLVFRETFNDEFSVRANSGVPTDVTFENGVGSFNGTSSKVNYNLYLDGVYSIRFIVNFTDFTDNRCLFDCRGTASDGTGYVYGIIGETVSAPSGTVYVNGNAGINLTVSTRIEIIISGITLIEGNGANKTVIGVNRSNTSEHLGTLDLVEIYNYTLSAEEVSNIYNNSRFIKPTGSSLLEVTAERGVIEDRIGNTFTNTDVEVVRDGEIWVYHLLGTSANINFGDLTSVEGINELTVSVWINPNTYASTNYILSKYAYLDVGSSFAALIGIAPASRVSFSVGDRYFFTQNTPLYNGIWNYLSFTYSNLVMENKIYINAIEKTISSSGGSFQPIPNSTHDLNIGRSSGNSFIGSIGDLVVDSTIWSAEKISQYYTSTKHKYGK